MTRQWLTFFYRAALMCSLCVVIGCSAQHGSVAEHRASLQTGKMVEALNALRNDINVRYGFRNGAPRINLGPCGRFARDFRERWNLRFREPATNRFHHVE